MSWYLAEIVNESRIQGETKSLVHINMTLIAAESPEEAYERALEVGKQGEFSYENYENRTVDVMFRGLRNLSPIYEELEHGSEIFYQEKDGLLEGQISCLVRSKTDLAAFQLPKKPKRRYMPKDSYESLQNMEKNHPK
jgi:hypothetical protein